MASPRAASCMSRAACATLPTLLSCSSSSGSNISPTPLCPGVCQLSLCMPAALQSSLVFSSYRIVYEEGGHGHHAVICCPLCLADRDFQVIIMPTLIILIFCTFQQIFCTFQPRILMPSVCSTRISTQACIACSPVSIYHRDFIYHREK